MTDESDLIKAIKVLDGAEFFGGLVVGVLLTVVLYSIVMVGIYTTATSNLGGCTTTEHKGETYVKVSPECTKLFNSLTKQE